MIERPQPEPGVPSLSAASTALAERRFEDAIALAERALGGELDRDVPPSERGEHYDLPERSLAHHILGSARLELGDRRGAIDALTQAVAFDPYSAFSFSNRAVARRDEGDVAGAVEDFGKAIALRRSYVHARYNRARLLAGLDRLAEAEADYLVILRIDAHAEPTRTEWAALRARMGVPADDAALAERLARG